MQIDPRTGKAIASEGDGEGVVASARALMRYRRSRNSNGADGTDGDYNAGGGSGAPRITVYQNPSRAPQQGNSGNGYNGSSNWLGGGDGNARPKSAGVTSSGGIMNAFGGSKGGRGGSGTDTGQGGLTYGAIKNRFLSSAQSKKSGSSKLFTSR